MIRVGSGCHPVSSGDRQMYCCKFRRNFTNIVHLICSPESASPKVISVLAESPNDHAAIGFIGSLGYSVLSGGRQVKTQSKGNNRK